MSTWRIAKSIDTLRAQINAQYPGRDKSSDGTIGDAVHASRSSDHNPHIKDGSLGVVTACDITHDPRNGCDAGMFASVLIASRDPRIKYIIWNRQVISGDAGPSAWKSRTYSGSNPHTKHVHLSVRAEKQFYDDAKAWAVPGKLLPKGATIPPRVQQMPTLLRGSTGIDVNHLQSLLGFQYPYIDGMFGPATEAAVIAFQTKNGLVPDGIAGPYTWAALLQA